MLRKERGTPHNPKGIHSKLKPEAQLPTTSEPVMSLEQSSSVSEGEPTTPTCTHHWLIESPHGPISFGTCKDCNETKEFKNYVEENWQGLNRDQSTALAKIREEISDMIGFDSQTRGRSNDMPEAEIALPNTQE